MTQKNEIEWLEVELGELGELIMGQSPKGNSYNDQGKGIPLLNGAADIKNKKISPKQFTTKPTKLSKKGDILFCIRATIGKTIVSDMEYCLGRGVAGFRANIKLLNPRFLLKILDKKLMGLVSQGSTIVGLKGTDIARIKIPIPFRNGKPDLEEQERIVKILEKSERLKEQSKKANELLDEYLKSVFYEMFLKELSKWKLAKLGEIFEIVRGGSPRPIEEFITQEEGGINWIKIGDTKGDSKYIYKTEQKIKPGGLKKSRLVKKGDFILSNSMSFGRPYILRTEGCIHDGWLLIRDINNQTNENYLYSILISDYVYSQFVGSASGSTVKNLNIDLVKKVKIPLPPLPLQQRFASIVEHVEKMKENVKKTQANTEELFNSLMQKAFRGGL